MKLFKKMTAGLLLTIGIPIVILTTIDLLGNHKSQQEKEDSLVVLCILGLPATALGGWLASGLYRDNQSQKLAIAKERRDRLQSTFFELIEAGEGRITVLRFAKETQLSGEEAKQFLDEKAKEFNATFDTDEKGGVSYYFHQ